jgi:hypothetical protein
MVKEWGACQKLNLCVKHKSGHINFIRMVTIPYTSTKIIKKMSDQVKLILSMTSWKLRRFCPVTDQVIITDKGLIQLKTVNCKIGVL